MLGQQKSSYVWSQSDLEDLGPSSPSPSSAKKDISATTGNKDSRRISHRANGYSSSLPPADNHELSISLDFLHNANEDDHLYAHGSDHPGGHTEARNSRSYARVPFGGHSASLRTPNSSSCLGEGPSRTEREKGWPSPSRSVSLQGARQPLLTRQLSHNTTSHISEHGTPPFPPPFSPFVAGPQSPFAPHSPATGGQLWSDHTAQRPSWYRTTSRLVDESDPVVYSSSSRSNREPSLNRSLSRGHESVYPSSPNSAALASSFRSTDHFQNGAALNGTSFSSEASAKDWPSEVHRHQVASAALYRSASASRSQRREESPRTDSWSTDSDMGGPITREGGRQAGVPAENFRPDPAGHKRLGHSPSRPDEFASSPRVLETMPEGFVHHPTTQPDYSAGRFPHSRMRSSSSAASLTAGSGRSEDSATTPLSESSATSPPRRQYGQAPSAIASDLARSRTTEAQRPGVEIWGRAVSQGPSSYGPRNGYEGDMTARQSPAESRRVSVAPGQHGGSDDGAFGDGSSHMGGNGVDSTSSYQPPHIAYPSQHGSESRRHSIAATGRLPVASGGQRRAVGFELRDSAGPTRSVSVDRDRVGSLEAETPRSRPHITSAAFSEDDLAADLGHLQLELDRISAERQEAEARGLSINLRVPSSQAATSGAHAASMPPLFGGGDRNLHPASSYSSQGWEAIIQPHSPSSSSGFEYANQPAYRSSASHFLQAPQSKSRSASVGPTAGGAPLRDRSFSTTESRLPSARFDDDTRAADSGTAAPATYRLSPQAQAFNVGNSNAQYRQEQPYLSMPSAPPPSLATDPRAGAAASMRFGNSLLPGSLAGPSAAGAAHSGVNASAAIFTPNLSGFGGDYGSFGRHDDMPNQQQQQQQQRNNPAFGGTGAPPFAPSASGNTGDAPASGLNEFTYNSLAGLGTISAPSGAGGPASLQDLGRGVPFSSLPRDTPLYIVGFKQGRTDLFFRPVDSASRGSETIRIDDLVIVEADRGKDIGRVVNDSITVDQVGSFLSSQGAGPSSSSHPASGKSNTPATRSSINPKRLYSKASLADTSLLASKASDEEKALMMCIQKVQQRNLPMRVISAELQWDRRKLTFYYIAGSRVDFRALVADLFKIWKVRIYMSQIPGPDQEGGGSAGGGGPGPGPHRGGITSLGMPGVGGPGPGWPPQQTPGVGQ